MHRRREPVRPPAPKGRSRVPSTWKPVQDHQAVTNVSWEFTEEAKNANVVQE